MTTQVIDPTHPILGFSSTWAAKIAARVDHLHVLALEVRRHELPSNVTVWSLGREDGTTRRQRFFRHQRTASSLLLTGQVDGVFVQQTEINVLMTAPYALVRRIPIVLFKAHSMSLRPMLKVANRLITRAITSVETAYPLDTWKKVVVGQGIDVDRLQPSDGNGHAVRSTFRVVSVGRLAQVKRYEVQVEAARLLRERGRTNVTFHIYGGWNYAGYAEYLARLRATIDAAGLTDTFLFEGEVPFTAIADVYREADVVVHSCASLSLDKAVLEAMACGIPVVVPEQPWAPIIGPHARELTFPATDAKAMADRIEGLLTRTPDERTALGRDLRDVVVRDHSADHFADTLVSLFTELTGTAGKSSKETRA